MPSPENVLKITDRDLTITELAALQRPGDAPPIALPAPLTPPQEWNPEYPPYEVLSNARQLEQPGKLVVDPFKGITTAADLKRALKDARDYVREWTALDDAWLEEEGEVEYIYPEGPKTTSSLKEMDETWEALNKWSWQAHGPWQQIEEPKSPKSL